MYIGACMKEGGCTCAERKEKETWERIGNRNILKNALTHENKPMATFPP